MQAKNVSADEFMKTGIESILENLEEPVENEPARNHPPESQNVQT